MPRYDFKCPVCGVVVEKTMTYQEMGTAVVICQNGHIMERQHTPIAFVIK